MNNSMKITRRSSSKVMAAVGGANSTGKFKWETTRTANTAKQYGIYDNLLRFSNALVQSEYIVDVDFDIDNIFEDAPLNSYICVLVQYSEDVDWKTFSPYKDVKPYVLRVSGDFGLRRTEDSIEDYGTWMYFVLKGAANSLYVADGSVNIDAACGKKSIKSSRRKTVRAAYEERRSFDAYGYNEDGDLEYEGLPYALDSIDEVTAWLKAMLDGVEEFKSQWTEWGGSTSELEMFGGPDDAENFGAEMYSNIIQNGLEPIANKLGDMLGVYIYP